MISVGFVLYNPEKDFVDRVELLKESGYSVYIFDNSPEYTRADKKLQKLYDVNYFTCGKNLGLGVGITSVCYNAFVDNFKLLLFFDQDTKFTLETLNYISKSFIELKDDFNLYAAIQFSNKVIRNVAEVNELKLEQKKLLISSGSLFNLKILKDINWHNTNYFVDGVDYEFCLRAHSKGYLLGEIANTPGFDHITGQEDRAYFILGIKRYLRAYNQSRLRDIYLSYLRLIIMSIKHVRMKYLLVFFNSFLHFTFYQLIVRILNFIKKYERN
jgi:rhamnosyltransferase